LQLKEKVTVVIPTNNRPTYLKRALDYWSKLSMNILVADSSTVKYTQTILKDIKYFHYPHWSFNEKMVDILNKIDTEYAVLCADDDFITRVGLQKSVEFLDNNNDYVIAHGKYILFNQSKKNYSTLIWRSIYSANSIENNLPSERLFEHLAYYSIPTSYAVHRTSIFKSIWKSAFKNTDDVRFGELLPTLLTLIYGKMKILDILYSAREYNVSSTSHTSKRLFDFIKEGTFDIKYKKFQECLTNVLVSKEDISKEKAQKLIAKAMKKYLGSSISKLKIKTSVKRIIERNALLNRFYLSYSHIKNRNKQTSKINNLPPIKYNNPESPYYEDFIHIKEAIENSNIK